MNKKMRYSVMHYTLCALLFFFIYILQSTPGFLEFWGYKPLLLAACTVSVAMLEQEYTGALFGAFAGMLCDLNANTYFGFNAIMFLLCGVTVGLLTADFVVGLCLVNYFFQFGIYNYPDAGFYWLKRILGTALPTVAFTPLIYWLFGALHQRFEKYKEL